MSCDDAPSTYSQVGAFTKIPYFSDLNDEYEADLKSHNKLISKYNKLVRKFNKMNNEEKSPNTITILDLES